MALTGKIQHKGIEVTVPYIKVSIIGISENIVRVPNENYDADELNAANENKELTAKQREELFNSMTDPVKKFLLQFGYSLKPAKDGEQFANGHETIKCDIDENLFIQAYDHLAEKFKISKEEI